MLLTRGSRRYTLRCMSNPNFGRYAGMPHRRGWPHKKRAAPAPSKHAAQARHLRCPVCGALRGEATFRGAGARDLAAKIKVVGGYKAIEWRVSPITTADRAQLATALRVALDRLGT